ncbi:MAG: redoxin domain-containing protein [Lentisphaeria bacterium]|nr:redoxin domain-containing protein [Lentisphaeria bacterium]
MKKILIFLLAFSSLFHLFADAVPTGSDAPEPALREWIKGKPFTIAEFKGKLPVVLFFWTVSENGSKNFSQVTKIAGKHLGKAVFLAIGCDSPNAMKKFFRLPQLGMPAAADKQLKTLHNYMRPNDKLPLCAVIDRKGKLVWRGTVKQLDAVLTEVINDRYDLGKALRREKLSNDINDALKLRNYDRALKAIDLALVEYPDNRELVSVKVKLLTTYKQDFAGAEKFLEERAKVFPENPLFCELAIQIMRQLGNLKKVDKWTKFAIEKFYNQPRTLLKLANAELQQAVDRTNIRNAWLLADTAWRNAGKLPAQEKGMVALEYARVLNHCGRPDKSVNLTQEAINLLKGRSKAGAEAYLKYYQEIVKLSKEL